MKEFNDLLSQFTRIADAMERVADSNDKIAAAVGVPSPHVETAPPAEQPKGKPGRKPKEKAADPTPLEEKPPVEVPPVESLFGDEETPAAAYTAEDVKHVLTLAMKALPEAEVARIFRECNGGVARLSLMKPEFYQPVIEKFQAVLEAMPE